MTTSEPPDFSIGKPQQIARSYKDSPKLRAVVEGIGSIVPGVTAVDTYLTERLSALERQRREALFSYLDEAGAQLTDELIANDDFLHCFTITVRAAQRTRRIEKIRLMARLLASTIKDAEQAITDVDGFEELLGILDEMSFRELAVLSALDQHQKPTPLPDVAWLGLRHQVSVDAGVSPNEVDEFFSRLTRTGLYREYIASPRGSNMVRGRLTARWHRLRQLIRDRQGNVVGPRVFDSARRAER